MAHVLSFAFGSHSTVSGSLATNLYLLKHNTSADVFLSQHSIYLSTHEIPVWLFNRGDAFSVSTEENFGTRYHQLQISIVLKVTNSPTIDQVKNVSYTKTSITQIIL